MPKKLSQQEFCQKVYDCVGEKYSVISEYKNKTSPITLHCNLHDIDFTVTAECFMRGSSNIRGKCPICIEEETNKRHANHRTEVVCAYCGKSFFKQNSKLPNSKSGLYFCCREHKDMAQRLESGEQFNIMRPDYNSIGKTEQGTVYNYRQFAFRNYEHQCAICGWDEDDDILEVHHIDENRENNLLSNLIILCPICHRKFTSHKYVLTNENQLIKQDI